MFPHLVATFMAACVSVTLPFTMFATPDLDNFEDCFWSQVWALVSRGLASVLFFPCFPWYKCVSLGALVSSIQSFVVLHLHRRLVCACLVCEVILTVR
ncbi:LOW QUALITY PROTEIN: hypothetical protein HID58_043258, partial [Brassica napus]